MANFVSGLINKLGFGRKIEGGVRQPATPESKFPGVGDGAPFMPESMRPNSRIVKVPSTPEGPGPRVANSPEQAAPIAPEGQISSNPSSENKG